MEKQLLEYVEQESKRGVPQPMIRKALRSAGWDERAIEDAFVALESRMAPPLPRPKAPEGEEAIIEDDFTTPETAKKTRRIPVKAISIGIFALVVLAVAAFIVWNYKEPVANPNPLPPVNNPAVPNQNETPATILDPGLTVTPATTTADNLAATSTNVSPMIPASTTSSGADPVAAARDAQRMDDMARLLAAQTAVFTANAKYYTCGLSGGDCQGKPNGYPAQIGNTLAQTPKDPLAAQAGAKPVCGKDYTYCGLNNAAYPQFFCYYAKLEGGGYYTASQGGNFKRSTPPKIFEECGSAN
ncbi:MAG: hypothetical protein MUD10_04715 [Candidatus Pacebacteria bacterium]|jgi:hypothetical protein|nr:hypothetical protein [Candidatus Paceibacterota bacterium]